MTLSAPRRTSTLGRFDLFHMLSGMAAICAFRPKTRAGVALNRSPRHRGTTAPCAGHCRRLVFTSHAQNPRGGPAGRVESFDRDHLDSGAPPRGEDSQCRRSQNIHLDFHRARIASVPPSTIVWEAKGVVE